MKGKLYNILVTGAGGQLGQSFKEYADGADNLIFVYRNQCDIQNEQQVQHFIDTQEIDIIINCAAYTAVDRAEKESERAYDINCIAVKTLAEACKKNDVLLIHYSTDYVYHILSSVPLKETDEKNPIGVYATSKRCGEEEIIESGCDFFILRTSWVYSEFGNNFMKTMLRLAENLQQIKVVDDQIGNPTYARDIVEATQLIIANYRGSHMSKKIYNFSNIGGISWYTFAKAIMEMANKETKILPIPSVEYPTAAVRPMWSVLDISKIEGEQGVVPIPWKISLRRALAALNLHNKTNV